VLHQNSLIGVQDGRNLAPPGHVPQQVATVFRYQESSVHLSVKGDGAVQINLTPAHLLTSHICELTQQVKHVVRLLGAEKEHKRIRP
jgi:hypothetical protein